MEQTSFLKTGLILSGINNIYRVKILGSGAGGASSEESSSPPEGGMTECRIKGKILKDPDSSSEKKASPETLYSNPLVSGDRVLLQEELPSASAEADRSRPFPEEVNRRGSPGLPKNRLLPKAQIIRRLPRANLFSRWQRKHEKLQPLAANLDQAFLVVTAREPAFKPLFSEKALLLCRYGDIIPRILVNKNDLPGSPELDEWLDSCRRRGIPVHRCSAQNRGGLPELEALLRGKTSVFLGLSGVGKSTLINHLTQSSSRKTGALSEKQKRGRHTTTASLMIPLPPPLSFSGESPEDSSWIIDTPGIQSLRLPPELLPLDPYYFPYFLPDLSPCGFSSCRHREEPRCSVLRALAEGRLSTRAYESYRQMDQETRSTAYPLRKK